MIFIGELMNDFSRALGQFVHDWGVGLGTFILGIGAVIAACRTEEILDTILKVQKTSNDIQILIVEMKKSEAQLKHAVDETAKILSHIDIELRKSTAKKVMASLPVNATNEQIQKSLSSLIKPPSSSEPYLTEKSMLELIKAWEITHDLKRREEILYKSLRVLPENKSYE